MLGGGIRALLRLLCGGARGHWGQGEAGCVCAAAAAAPVTALAAHAAALRPLHLHECHTTHAPMQLTQLRLRRRQLLPQAGGLLLQRRNGCLALRNRRLGGGPALLSGRLLGGQGGLRLVVAGLQWAPVGIW